MKSKLLLPQRYKKLGWFLLIPSTIMGIISVAMDVEPSGLNAKVFAIFNDEVFGKSSHFSFIQTNITNTLIGILFIIGAMLVCFSKEKQEDEFIAELRLNSLLWAVAVNYILLLLAFIFVYGTPFLQVMIYNMSPYLSFSLAGSIFYYTKTTKLYPMKNKLKIERAIHNLTQDELAKKIGVSRQTINAMEANKYVPSTVLALKIAKLFNTAVETIFLLEDSD